MLGDKQKEYLLAYSNGETIPQIAERFGVNKSTVSRIIKSARKRIAWYIDNIYIARIEIE